MIIRRTGIAAAILACAVLAACGSDSTGPDDNGGGGGPGGATVTIAMRDNQFDPASRTVERGTTVRWVNQGSTAHNTRAGGNAWSSANLPPGEDFEVTLSTAGTYAYQCTLHEGMNGTIVVN